MLSRGILPLIMLSIIGFSCSSDDRSKLNASNQYNGKTVSKWYELFTIDSSKENSFIKFHQQNKDLMLGNRYDFLPENLKGLWFMDGNPAGDLTINFSNVKPGRDESEDFYLEVNTPMTFSWTNLKENHRLIGMIDSVRLTYSIKFLDCPEDVKKERESMWGMGDGGCKAEDKEFAIVTPIVKGPLGDIKVPQSIAYFDMYLRPKTQDYLVWERRSKVFSLGQSYISKLTALFRSETKDHGFHRYRFTQVMSKDAQVLSSYELLAAHAAKIAIDNNRDQNQFVFYLCYDGAVGCSRQALQQEETVVIEPSKAAEYGAVPLL